jgi:tetratricopeptide (TPR) repeat protein
VHQLAFLHWLKATPYFALARFGKWDDILKEAKPAHDAHFETAAWHYARGLAFARQRKRSEAQAEAKELARLAESKEIEALQIPEFPGASVTKIASTILSAEVAGGEQRIVGLQKAVELQDELPYMEPPFWYFPVRQALGAALLEAGDIKKAEAVYREDLRQHPENGWSLYGLLQTLRAQGRSAEADAVEARFRDAWRHADFVLTRSAP